MIFRCVNIQSGTPVSLFFRFIYQLILVFIINYPILFGIVNVPKHILSTQQNTPFELTNYNKFLTKKAIFMQKLIHIHQCKVDYC